MGRESGRRRNRREVVYKLSQGADAAPARRAMTGDEVDGFVRAIRKGLKNHFGLVKMSGLDLNALIPIPAPHDLGRVSGPDAAARNHDADDAHSGPQEMTGAGAAQTTLLEFASLCRADAVSYIISYIIYDMSYKYASLCRADAVSGALLRAGADVM